MDEYTQDLNRLCQKTYPQANQGSQVAETMSRVVLAYQIVSRLLPGIQVKLASMEGTFDQLWIKTRFEEAV